MHSKQLFPTRKKINDIIRGFCEKKAAKSKISKFMIRNSDGHY